MRKFFLLATLVLIVIGSCKKDDDGIESIPPRTLSEQVNVDNDSIVDYLSTHFYNYEEFENPPAGFDYRIKIGKIEGANADKKPLIEQVKTKIIALRSDQMGAPVSGDEEVDHKLYYLEALKGEGLAPKFSDSVYVRYEGSLLDGRIFDGATEVPVWFNGITVVRGMAASLPFFNAGVNPTGNPDGTFNVDGYGVGMIIMPSALGYFGASQPGIPAYSPLIFKLDMMSVNEADHDRDGVPTWREDLNGNEYVLDDNTDEQRERDRRAAILPDYIDPDDDGDLKPTRTEVTDIDNNVLFPYPDTNNDGTPDYLDYDIRRDPEDN
ncbi:FKBP-type peptidyl-prolyl cis-trans isomerase [Sediminicola luteus]|uniref:peptidylprolyl isomerase n=1 Tax=Sediminicola luteus TaxID=319238 RepID=A0A2A4G6F5_9FLAO|nr:hypothetical protein [Sediminicola luteus]PCE63568.1 hypothetical protein B7P33_15340 [Sediminicola luteus]